MKLTVEEGKYYKLVKDLPVTKFRKYKDPCT